MVDVRNAYKSFKETKALNNVSIHFEARKIHGLIGRNGSGKTVLLKSICGFMKLDKGEILVQGTPIHIGAAQNMGIIIEEPGFVNSLSGFENLKMLSSIWKKTSYEKIVLAMQKVGLESNMKKNVSKYSLGMRQRLGIAQAIIDDPPLLLLDEPMNGLDNDGVKEIRQLLLDLKGEGKTIILASHNREDVEILCDTVAEMDKGHIITRY